MIIKIKSNYYVNDEDIVLMVANSGRVAKNIKRKYKIDTDESIEQNSSNATTANIDNFSDTNSSIINLSGKKKTLTLLILRNGMLILLPNKADTIFTKNYGKTIIINDDETEGPQ